MSEETGLKCTKDISDEELDKLREDVMEHFKNLPSEKREHIIQSLNNLIEVYKNE